jgi:YesN/AraC family two-component response regulator
MKSYIDDLTRTSLGKRDILFKWYGSQSERARLEIASKQSELTRQNRAKIDNSRIAEFHFSMLTIAINKMHWLESAMYQKSELSREEAREITHQNIARVKSNKKRRPSTKRNVISIQFYKEIRMLRSQDMSWRDIAFYMKTRHKTNIGWSYLRKCFIELTDEKSAAGITDDE